MLVVRHERRPPCPWPQPRRRKAAREGTCQRARSAPLWATAEPAVGNLKVKLPVTWNSQSRRRVHPERGCTDRLGPPRSPPSKWTPDAGVGATSLSASSGQAGVQAVAVSGGRGKVGKTSTSSMALYVPRHPNPCPLSPILSRAYGLPRELGQPLRLSDAFQVPMRSE